MLILFQTNVRQLLICKVKWRVEQGTDQGIVIMQVVNHGQQTQEGLHLGKPKEVRNTLVHCGDVHLFQMIDNG